MKRYLKEVCACIFFSVILSIAGYFLLRNFLSIDNNVKLYFLSAIIQSNCALFGLILVSIGIIGNREIRFYDASELYVSYSSVSTFIFIIIFLSIISMLTVTNTFFILFIASMEIFAVSLILAAIYILIDEFKNYAKKNHHRTNDSVI